MAKSFSQKYMKKTGVGEPVKSSNNTVSKKSHNPNTQSNYNSVASRGMTMGSAEKQNSPHSNKPSNQGTNHDSYKSSDTVMRQKIEAMMSKDTRDFTSEEKRLMEKIRSKQLN